MTGPGCALAYAFPGLFFWRLSAFAVQLNRCGDRCQTSPGSGFVRMGNRDSSRLSACPDLEEALFRGLLLPWLNRQMRFVFAIRTCFQNFVDTVSLPL
jgi:hypothetical protein